MRRFVFVIVASLIGAAAIQGERNAPSSTSTVYETVTVMETVRQTTTSVISMTTTLYWSYPTGLLPSSAGFDDSAGPVVEGRLTWDQFKRAISFYNLTSAGGLPPVPSRSIYSGYLRMMGAYNDMGLVEQAMLLANLIWETAGFQHREELACRHATRPTRQCPYGFYYGRGWIQLSWEENYRKASQDIFGDDRLARFPELASTDDGAWRVALWYWGWAVRPRLLEHGALESLAFGHAVRAINGQQECSWQAGRKLALLNRRWHPKRNFQAALNRLIIFNAILKDIGLISDQDDDDDDERIGSLAGCIDDLDQLTFPKMAHLFSLRDMHVRM